MTRAPRPAIGRHADAERCHVRLTYRPPYDWDALLAFLAARATPGVESVAESCYRRTITIGGETGVVNVAHLPAQSALDVEVRVAGSSLLPGIVDRLRRVFDLDADPALIGEHLGADSFLQGGLEAHPGIRMPGAWDGFELAVRAIIGQQISVRAATTLAGRVASMFGSPVPVAGTLDRLFPTAQQLADAALERVGLMPIRAGAIRSLARAVLDRSISFEFGSDVDATVAALEGVPGIGEWTSQYIAMRALGEPDAFLPGDLVLRRVVGARSARELERRSAAWRPWRAYAVMLLWQGAIDETNEVRRTAHAQRVVARRRDRDRVSADRTSTHGAK
jgi:AraC family transcriptional regulator, regulatory protein of adaptative response / DNA-3-methyladenine glycosylase II